MHVTMASQFTVWLSARFSSVMIFTLV